MLRLRFGFVIIAIVLSVFGARLVQLQALDPHAYAAAAAKEGLVNAVQPARRGAILDRNGEPLASSVDGLMVVADPVQTTDKAAEIAKLLATRLGIDYLDAKAALSREDTRFAYVARRVPATLATDVLAEAKELGYKGLDTRVDPVRDYPAHDVAANIVGFMDAFNQPLAGFEQAFNTSLAGKDGWERYQVGGGNRIPLGVNDSVDPVDGTDLHTTLDRDTQWYVQRVLAQTVKEALRRLGHGCGDGQPHGRDHRAGRLSDVRRGRPRGVREGAPRRAVGERAVRARIGREGADHGLA